MKILQVVPYFYPAWAYGGPVKIVYEVSKELVRRGHEVTVYTTDVYDRQQRIDAKRNVPVDVEMIRTYYFENVSDVLAYDFNFFLTPQLVPVMRRDIRGYDIIHLHEYYTFQNIVAHYYATKHGVPYILNAHASLCPVRRRQKSWMKRAFTRLWGNRLLKDLSKAIALTVEEKTQYIAMGVPEDRIEIIPNGVHLAELGALPTRGAFKGKYGIKNNEKVVLFLGRIQKIKGLDLLVSSVSDLIKKGHRIKLVIVGPEEGGYRAVLEKLIVSQGIQGRILFTGLLSGTEKLSAYVDADVFVLPSHSEGFPMAVLEACASRIPVIITEQCNVPEVSEFEAGFVINRDHGSFVATLTEVLRDSDLRQRLGENGRRMVRERFTWDAVVDKLAVVYRSLLESSSLVDTGRGGTPVSNG